MLYSLLNQKEEAITWTEKEYEVRCDAFGSEHPRTKRTKLSLWALRKEVYGTDEVSDTDSGREMHISSNANNDEENSYM